MSQEAKLRFQSHLSFLVGSGIRSCSSRCEFSALCLHSAIMSNLKHFLLYIALVIVLFITGTEK